MHQYHNVCHTALRAGLAALVHSRAALPFEDFDFVRSRTEEQATSQSPGARRSLLFKDFARSEAERNGDVYPAFVIHDCGVRIHPCIQPRKTGEVPFGQCLKCRFGMDAEEAAAAMAKSPQGNGRKRGVFNEGRIRTQSGFWDSICNCVAIPFQ